MIGPVRRTLTLIVLSIRDLLASAGPVALIAVGVLVGAYWWLDPQPPKTVALATGPEGSAYAEFGQRYAQALARNGITVQQLTTEGSLANLQALRQGTAGAAFVRGGSADPKADGEAGISSLGALFYEPIWVFYRVDALPPAVSDAAKTRARPKPGTPAAPPMELTTLPQLKGLRVNIDQPGSGVPDMLQRLLQANELGHDTLVLSQLPPAAATEALPPASSTACTTPTRLAGSSRSVSRVPGAAPRTSTPPTAPARAITTLQPVGRRVSVKWPTSMPRTRVMSPGCSVGGAAAEVERAAGFRGMCGRRERFGWAPMLARRSVLPAAR